MQGTLIRKKFNGEFRNLRGNSLSVCVATLLSYVTQIGACIVLGAIVLSLPENSLALIMLPMLCFFIGTRLRGLNNIVHECSHLSFCADRAENWWLGRLTASFLLKSFAAYRLEHMSHHAHLGDYERDEDFKVIERFQLEAPLTPLTILRHIVTPFTGLHVLYYFSTNMSKDDGAQYALLKWALVAGAAIGLAIAPVTTLVMVVARRKEFVLVTHQTAVIDTVGPVIDRWVNHDERHNHHHQRRHGRDCQPDGGGRYQRPLE
ncbi:MAG: fatty acid desaturase, partial [Pseudomonadota bacterium]